MRHHDPTLPAGAAGTPFLTTMPDEILIALIAAHDKDAMRILFTRHNVRVFRFLLRILGDAATAEDLVSEVFIDIWRHAGRFEARSQVSTWILAIARFKAASARRRKSFDQLDEGAAASIADTADDPEAATHKKKRNAVLRDCLKQLSPEHREILDLIYYHGQSVAEAAQIIGVPENTVKTRAFHARKRIAQLMARRGIDRVAI
jgi:RNA polymerase sigma-70 factor, ECF subfamily